jgi:hypothetical protein
VIAEDLFAQPFTRPDLEMACLMRLSQDIHRHCAGLGAPPSRHLLSIVPETRVPPAFLRETVFAVAPISVTRLWTACTQLKTNHINMRTFR